MATKICSKCKVEKDVDEFNKNKSTRDGLRTECKECRFAYSTEHKEYISAYKKEHYRKNKVKYNERSKRYYVKNREYLSVSRKRYNQLSRTKKHRNKRNRNRYAIDHMLRLNESIRNNIGHSLKGAKNGRHWETLVGYTLKQLKKHLEKLFTKGMNWENYGREGWVIDHKVPKIAFNFTKPEHRDFRRCWALKNLQPMWELDNMIKNRRLEHHFQPSLLI